MTDGGEALTHAGLFSGIGGIDLGAERAGFRCLWTAEIDERCRSVLARHFPDAQHHEDVRHVTEEQERPTLLSGGFPCQDLSVAGKRAGLDGGQSASGLSSGGSLLRWLPPGFSSRTSLVSCPPTEGRTSPYSWRDWPGGDPRFPRGDGGRQGGSPAPTRDSTVLCGECWTLNTSESPSAGVGSSLSRILEGSVPPKYYLSRRACRGILNRLEQRGRRLPPLLCRVLEESVGRRMQGHGTGFAGLWKEEQDTVIGVDYGSSAMHFCSDLPPH